MEGIYIFTILAVTILLEMVIMYLYWKLELKRIMDKEKKMVDNAISKLK